MTIDTLEYVRRLEAAGVARPQAEAHAQAVRDTLAPQLATKADLDALATRLDGKIDTAVARIEGRMLLLQWMLGFNLAGTLGLLGLMVRLPLK